MSKEIVPEDFLKKTIGLKKDIERSFLELGARLLKIRDSEMYFPSYQNFPEFLLEMRMSEGNASKLISVYQKFVLNFGISEEKLIAVGSWSTLYEIGKHATSREHAEELVEGAKHQTRDDTIKLLKGDDAKVAACRHSDTYLLRVCRGCGDKAKVHEDNK